MSVSAGTVLNLHLLLTQAVAQAVRWQLLAANPVAGAQPPRPRRPPRLLVDRALLARLLASVAGRWLEAPAAIAVATGMRRGEALGLRWADLAEDFSAAQVQQTLQPTREGLVFESPKTARSRRTVLLPDFCGHTASASGPIRSNGAATRPPGRSSAWSSTEAMVGRSTRTPSRPAGRDTCGARSCHLPGSTNPFAGVTDVRRRRCNDDSPNLPAASNGELSPR